MPRANGARRNVVRMRAEAFDRESWEQRWKTALSKNAHAVADRPPNAYLVAEASELAPGLALDAGAGHGAESIWLAARGWRVTAVDFSATALDHARSSALEQGSEVAERVEWIEADMMSWSPPTEKFDLVLCLYMHIAGSVEEVVRRLAAAVAPGGSLLLVGHRPVDPESGEPTPAAGQNQISVDEAVAALDPERWKILIAEDRPREAAGSGVDAVVCAVAHELLS